MSPIARSLALIAYATLLLPAVSSLAQQAEEIPLWPNGAPGAVGTSPKDIPTIKPYLAAAGNNSGAAIIVCPGGGYVNLAAHEGNDYAIFLSQRGINCFVLKYRLGPTYHYPIETGDAARAMRYVRANAEQWKLDPKKVGIMGSSAGGHLASAMVTHFDAGDAGAADLIERQSSRPDFGILCYAVITMGESTHAGSKNNLLGPNPTPELVALLSSELQVTPQTPPCFIWHGLDDRTVPVANAFAFADALRKNKVPFDLHIYEHASHGLGLGDRTPPFAHPLPWTGDLMLWLQSNQIIPRVADSAGAPARQPATRPAAAP